MHRRAIALCASLLAVWGTISSVGCGVQSGGLSAESATALSQACDAEPSTHDIAVAKPCEAILVPVAEPPAPHATPSVPAEPAAAIEVVKVETTTVVPAETAQPEVAKVEVGSAATAKTDEPSEVAVKGEAAAAKPEPIQQIAARPATQPVQAEAEAPQPPRTRLVVEASPRDTAQPAEDESDPANIQLVEAVIVARAQKTIPPLPAPAKAAAPVAEAARPAPAKESPAEAERAPLKLGARANSEVRILKDAAKSKASQPAPKITAGGRRENEVKFTPNGSLAKAAPAGVASKESPQEPTVAKVATQPATETPTAKADTKQSKLTATPVVPQAAPRLKGTRTRGSRPAVAAKAAAKPAVTPAPAAHSIAAKPIVAAPVAAASGPAKAPEKPIAAPAPRATTKTAVAAASRVPHGAAKAAMSKPSVAAKPVAAPALPAAAKAPAVEPAQAPVASVSTKPAASAVPEAAPAKVAAEVPAAKEPAREAEETIAAAAESVADRETEVSLSEDVSPAAPPAVVETKPAATPAPAKAPAAAPAAKPTLAAAPKKGPAAAPARSPVAAAVEKRPASSPVAAEQKAPVAEKTPAVAAAPLKAPPSVAPAPVAAAQAKLPVKANPQSTSRDVEPDTLTDVVPPRNRLPWAKESPHTPQMVAVSRRAEERVRFGFELAEQGATYLAKAEFMAALKQIAQANDEQQETRMYSRAVTAGLLALKESSEFTLPSSTIEEADVAKIVNGHKTTLLKDVDVTDMTPSVAAQRYCAYAQEQLAVATAHEMSGSMALYGLGRVVIMGSGKRVQNPESLAQARALYRAALTAEPKNFRAANELGVLLAENGQPELARDLFVRSVSLSPQLATWQNLATLHARMGDRKLAEDAQAQVLALRRPGQGAGGPAVHWVDPATFAKTVPATDNLMPAATPATAEAAVNESLAETQKDPKPPGNSSRKGGISALLDKTKRR